MPAKDKTQDYGKLLTVILTREQLLGVRMALLMMPQRTAAQQEALKLVEAALEVK